MMGVSTLTQKGQVVIPLAIRKALNLKPATRIAFDLQGDTVILKPVLTVDQAFGMIKTNKRVTEKEYKEAIRLAVIKKFSKRNHGLS